MDTDDSGLKKEVGVLKKGLYVFLAGDLTEPLQRPFAERLHWSTKKLSQLNSLGKMGVGTGIGLGTYLAFNKVPWAVDLVDRVVHLEESKLEAVILGYVLAGAIAKNGAKYMAAQLKGRGVLDPLSVKALVLSQPRLRGMLKGCYEHIAPRVSDCYYSLGANITPWAHVYSF